MCGGDDVARRSMLMGVLVLLTAVLVLQHTLGGPHVRVPHSEKSEEYLARGLPELATRKHLPGGLSDDGTRPDAVAVRLRPWGSDDASAPHSGPADQSARHAVRATNANTARPLALLQVFRH
nr:hypothetical protein [Kibdelosporangium sp. MJ126-NF4]